MKDGDLAKVLREKQTELQKIRFTFSHGGQKNTKRQANLRKEISQIMTEMRNRELRNN